MLCPGGSKAPGPYPRKSPRLSRGGHPCVHWGHLQGAGVWAVLKGRCLASSSLASFLGPQTGPLGIPQVTKTPFPRPPFPRGSGPGQGGLRVRGWAPLAAGRQTRPGCDAGTDTVQLSGSCRPCGEKHTGPELRWLGMARPSRRPVGTPSQGRPLCGRPGLPPLPPPSPPGGGPPVAGLSDHQGYSSVPRFPLPNNLRSSNSPDLVFPMLSHW